MTSSPAATPEGGDWRSQAVVEALSRHLEVAPPTGHVLVLADLDAGAARLFESGADRVTRWSRVVTPGAVVSPWPPSGSWGTVALRLPRAKDELEMLVHAAASVLEPGGVFLVYGANDEGIRSAPSRIEPLFGGVDTVAVKSRCRVLRARRPDDVEGLRRSLTAWRETWRLSYAGLEREWVSYPGVFSHGRLDPGTRLLLDSMDPTASIDSMDFAGSRGSEAAFPEDLRVLDYGCGSGVIAGVMERRLAEATGGSDRTADSRLHLLDADAIALEAARENVPGGRFILADGLAALDDAYDLIVSNPPYHRGKAEDRGVLEALVREAPSHLREGGVLVMVVQRRFAAEALLERAFDHVGILGEDSTYRVWRGTGPRR